MTCLCATTRRAARNLTRLYEDHLGGTGLTPPQFHLLSLLAQKPNLSQFAIAEALDLDQTTLSRNLRILIAQKHAQRRPSPTDARQAIYSITPAGLKAQQNALPHWQRAQHQMQQLLGDDWQTAFAILERLSITASAQLASV